MPHATKPYPANPTTASLAMSDAMTPAPMIDVRGISVSFGTTRALNEVSLQVEGGTVLGLLGPNGSGKTTLVRVLTTLLVPDSGTATIAGFDMRHDAVPLRSMIGLAGQSAAVDDLLTGRENLELVGLLYHLSAPERRRRAQEVLERLTLTGVADRLVRTYSGGLRRRLDLGASLVGRPAVLLLDEPTTGLDPATRLDLWLFIEDLVREGTTVLLTTQYLDEADRLADRIVVIDHGQVIAQGTSEQLKDQLGDAVLDVGLADPLRLSEAAGILSNVAHAAASVDDARFIVSAPAAGGGGAVVEVARRLDAAGIELVEIALRRPSLDEVFLSLTGHAPAAPTASTLPVPGSKRSA